MYQYDPNIHEVRSIPDFDKELQKMYVEDLKRRSLQQQNAFLYGEFSHVSVDEVRLDAQEHFKRMEAIKQKMHADFIQSNRKEFESLQWKFDIRGAV